MANFPASLDALSNPVATTKRNDPGFELHTVISTLNDIVELLEAKVGITDSPAQDSALANTVLTSLANGKSGWKTVATAMLAANAVTQSGAAVGTGVVTTISATYVTMTDMSVTLTTVGGDLLVWFGSDVSHSLAANYVFCAISLDGATPVGDRRVTPSGAGEVAGCNTWARFTGVSAGSHTVTGKWLTQAATATAVGTERSLLVVEVKR